ncbi:Fe-S cluster assembly protein SufD [Bacteriovorax sp. Seq25_V]|uniref:Fe-S cluster assembly protein SufD n=1 Tax=Bacteriovorax sp. Seq25_V TaxID=1201288 RepID=UPI000389F1CE|nr:Fe-S cluster assembly protein SufD [Bacteriovorax sp. Seq25_V]EQC46075.1 FeS assembly protein SufD [Bacteriovorax sp. Seq25_V]
MNIEETSKQYIEDLQAVAGSTLQIEALELFKKRGLPTTKQEDWLYTKLSDVLPSKFEICNQPGELENVKVAGKYQIVFVNGVYNQEESFFPEDLIIENTSANDIDSKDCIDDEKDTFAMLNGAATTKILNITVPKNVILDDVVSIVHLSNFENSFATPRVHITCERFSNSNFVEIFKGRDGLKYNNLSVTNFKLEDGAITTHTKVQTEGNSAFHFSSVNAEMAKDSSFNSFTFTTGAKKSRNNIDVRLKGTGATASVDGLYALRGAQHCDNFSLIEHIEAHTESSQLFKGILDDSSRGVFTGKVLICRDAQKVNSEQLNKNLLLSKKAHADTRPQLEVYADDVKCAHGATVGQMSDEEAFYLMSRGLSRDRVQKLLIHAFCADAISKIGNDQIEKFLSEVLFESFEKDTFKHMEEV